MATRNSIEELRGVTDVELGGTLFVVNVDRFGYHNIPTGTEQYLVIEEGGDLAIHRVDASFGEDRGIVFEVEDAVKNAPVIRVIDGDVFYTSKARQDPYQQYFNEITAEETGSTTDKVLDAFTSFVKGNYSTGSEPYITYYDGDIDHETGAVIVNGPVEEEDSTQE